MNPGKSDGWVTIGRHYVVLAVYGRGDGLRYRIIGDDGITPAFQDAEQFEITSSEIPTNWIFRVYPNLEWEMTHKAFSDSGFWSAFFDGDSSATSIFEQMVLEMNAIHTGSIPRRQ
jgi:hypothetical protein